METDTHAHKSCRKLSDSALKRQRSIQARNNLLQPTEGTSTVLISTGRSDTIPADELHSDSVTIFALDSVDHAPQYRIAPDTVTESGLTRYRS